VNGHNFAADIAYVRYLGAAVLFRFRGSTPFAHTKAGEEGCPKAGEHYLQRQRLDCAAHFSVAHLIVHGSSLLWVYL